MGSLEQYPDLKKFRFRISRFTDSIAYLVIIPLSAIVFYFALDLVGNQSIIFFALITMFILIALAINILSTNRMVRPILQYFNKWAEGEEISDDEFLVIRRDLLNLPRKRAIGTALRFGIIIPIIIIIMSIVANLSLINMVNMWAITLTDVILGALIYYFFTTVEVERVAELGIFDRDIDLTRSARTRMGTTLSILVIAAMSLFMILMIASVFNLDYRMLKRDFSIQMKIITGITQDSFSRFFSSRKSEARFIASSPDLVEGVLQQQTNQVVYALSSYYHNFSHYEYMALALNDDPGTIFASTSEGVQGKSLRELGFHDNLEAAETGNMHFSEPVASSITGKPVIMITTPILDGNRTIGILVLPVELSGLVQEIVKKVKIGKTGYLLITDGEYNIIGHPDPSMVLKNLKGTPLGDAMKTKKTDLLIEYFDGDKRNLLYKSRDFQTGFIIGSHIQVSDIEENVWKTEIVLIGITIAGILAVGLFLFLIIRRKVRPLVLYQDTFDRISEGDLTRSITVTSTDEIGIITSKLSIFMNRLKNTIGDIKEIADELASSSEEMSSSTESFSENAQSQASSAEEITATVEEVSAGIENISTGSAEQSEILNDLMQSMKELSGTINEMNEQVMKASSTSQDIEGRAREGEDSLVKLNSSMESIQKSSEEITGIVSIINDISEQINLLSLNASIEAARAGEQGRGFAVVADEISKLADQTAQSLKEIDRNIRQNNEEINQGLSGATDTSRSMQSIIQGVTEISAMMSSFYATMNSQLEANEEVNRKVERAQTRSEEIRNATSEQKTATSEIVRSIGTINELTQANASGAEEMTANAHSVSNLADTLKQAVDFFSLDEESFPSDNEEDGRET
jgi:methyl-accepting chemotaxis protein